ncbi:phage baseplate assembly protein V [Klebsiella aerogenes]|uniref:phage baseplate assembly protein V n=1 Tax=Klebsiella aerogenes TaxID=548 RepID=UPI001F2B238C|nr:phage baseplate assembly protein V [Klebsiella aerogenes]
MSEFDLSMLSQQQARMCRFGNIIKVRASPPACRVTFGTDPISGEVHMTGWLPWSASVDSAGSDWRMPAVGASVMVLSPGGNLANGLVFPAGYTDDITPPSDKPGQYVTRYSDGGEVLYDVDAHEMKVSLPAGGKLIIVAAGGVKITGNLEVDGDIRDKTGTMQAMRDVHNAHTHNENGEGGGVTDPPNQKMQSEEEPDP